VKDALFLFMLSVLGASITIAARFGYQLEQPPEDAEAYRQWKRKLLWTAASEIATVPTIAVGLTLGAIHYEWSPVVTVGLSMLCGAAGFGVLIDAAQRIILRKSDNV
jgi:hypothetical protein